MKKFEKLFSSIFFVQDVAWDLQKCILEIFLKNLYTILNASYFVVENFERSGPFFQSVGFSLLDLEPVFLE